MLKQQSRGIIIVILVFRCEFIQKRSTKINLFQGICDRRNWGNAARYGINIKHIDIMYADLDYKGNIIQVFIRLFNYHKTFG